MLFEGLSKIKRTSLMSSIVLMAIGIFLVMWPGEQIALLMEIVGVLMLVTATVLFFNHLSSEKSLMDYVLFTVALVLALMGIAIFTFKIETIYILCWIFGIIITMDGIHGLVHTLVFARRSHKKSWGILLPLAILLLIFGLTIIIHPWWHTPAELKMLMGLTIIASAVIGFLRIIWIWPIQNES